jgi:alpha-glucosidase (family GH31 glycosyl hydrolase)
MKTEYNFNLHGLFGSQVAIQLRKAFAPEHNALVASGSTFAGAGAHGIAHILARTKNDWTNLKYSVSNILNFNMFGIPNVGPNLCGYITGDDKEQLCLRSFQLNIISPIALF